MACSDGYFANMNTILEIRNTRSKADRREGSLPHRRKTTPIPPIHYTWNQNIECAKMNTILEIRNPRSRITDRKESTIQRSKKVGRYCCVIFFELLHN